MKKKKNGFISMSLIYSFFIVFVAISISLLAIYSSNLSLVKNVNKEIKEDLIERGNEELVVFNNLIKDGSFEQRNTYWQVFNNGTITDKQKYYGNYSLKLTGYSSAKSTSINFIKNHIYFIERIYQTPQTIAASISNIPTTTINFQTESVNGHSPTIFSISNSEISSRERAASPWCGNTTTNNCSSKTIENTIFRFTEETNKYSLNVSTYNVSSDFYTDGYILIDLTEAFGESKSEDLLSDVGSSSQKIEDVIGTDYFEGRKVFSTYKAGI